MENILTSLERLINNTRCGDDNLLTDAPLVAVKIKELFEQQGWTKEPPADKRPY